jgi:hypothetical protein
MKKFTLLIALLIFSITSGYSQASLYNFASSSGTFVPITGGTLVTSATGGTPSLDSYVSAQQTLPAAFTFAGISYTTAYVTGNGQIALGTTAPGTDDYNVISASRAGNVFLAPFSADLATGASGTAEIRFQQTGDEIVFQWTNFRRYNRAESFSFQARLNTTTNAISFVYDGTPPFDASTSYQPQVGIKSGNGDYSAISIPTGSTWGTATVVTTGASTVLFSGSTGFTSGLTYTWTQPAGCTTTPVAGTITGELTRAVCSGSAPGVITVTGGSAALPGITYQWEQSVDSGTTWINAAGGTGAATTSFTPPNYAGAPIQYRLKVTCANGGDSVYSNVITVTGQSAPANQVTATTIAAATSFATSFTVTWTNPTNNGSVARRVVIVSTTPIIDPVNGSAPVLTASGLYAGTGQQVVYDGTGTSATIYGVNCATTYYVKVFEYNRCGSGPYEYFYNVTTGSNATTVATPALPAAVALPVANNFTGFTGTNLSVSSPGWYEAVTPGTSGTAPVASYPSGNTSAWTNSTAFTNPTAKVNLFTNSKNEWIISPKMQLTENSRLKFKAAITDYNSSGPADEDMEGTDDKVKVLVSTDGCGLLWTPIYTFSASNTTELTNVLVDFELSLSAYTGQSVQIAFEATDGPLDDDPDYDFHIGNIVVEVTPACSAPLALTFMSSTENSAQVSWTAPSTAPANGYQYYTSTSATPPTATTAVSGSVAAGVTTATISPLASSTANYVWVRSNCATGLFSDWAGPITFNTLCDGGEILTVTPGTVCGQGVITLQATANANAIINWYSAETGGTLLATGANYSTPAITETTNYYVSAGNVTSSVDVAVGQGSSRASGYVNPFYSNWSNSHTQHLITAQELSAAGILPGNINSIALDVTSAGTLPLIDLSVKIGTSTATNLSAFASNTSFATVYTNASYTPVMGVNTLTFTTPFVWDGTSNIVVEFCHGNPNSSATMNRIVKSDVTSFVSSVKYHVSDDTSASEVCGVTTGSNLASYSERPQFTFNGRGLCSGVRQAVTATVTDAPAITVAASDAEICSGDSTTLTVISENAGYTYSWTPGTGLTGISQVVAPLTTTTYTVTATDTVSGCVTTDEVTVTVNALPAAISVTDDATVCPGTVQALTVSGTTVAGTVTIGTGTTAPGATTYPNPFNSYYGGVKTQILVRESELLAQGLTVGSPINSISFDFLASVAAANNDLRIKIGSTSLDAFTTAFVPSQNLTTVYSTTFTPTAGTTGWVPFAFTTPYIWNGGNIVVEVAHNAGNSGNGQGTRTTTTTTAYNSVYTGAIDDTEPAVVASLDALDQTDYSIDRAETSRPNVMFNYSFTNSVVWSPATGLFTDEGATTAYTNQNVATVYAKPAATTSYTVTATNAAGCTISDTAVVTVTAVTAPEAPATQTFCGSAVVGSLMPATDGIQWYSAATGGIALVADVALTNDTVYYASQTINGCESARTPVTVVITTVSVDNLEDVTQCGGTYTLPILTNGVYYTQGNGAGEMLNAGTPITETTTLFIFATSGTTPNCTAETSFTVTINTTPTPEGDTTQSIAIESGEVATIEDIEVTTVATGTIAWYANESDAIAGIALPAGTQLTVGSTYYATQTVNGCTSTGVLAVTIEEILGEKGFDLASFSFYPNPVNNVLNITYSSSISSIAIYNLVGQQVAVQQPNANNASVDTSLLAEGTYIVKVTVENAVKTFKVIKKN